MKIFIWIWAKITGRELIWLKDIDGEVTLSIKYIDVFGETVAKRYWPLNIHTVKLLDNGKVDGSYVKYWKPF